MTDSTITIIAENAINYNSMEEAYRLIEREAEIKDATGVDIFSKFQLYDKVVNPEHAEYCNERQLDFKQAEELFQFGADLGQTVFFTPMEVKYVEWCERLGVEYYKIRYHDRMNWKLHLKITETMKKTFISVDTSYHNYIMNHSTFIPLLCVPLYPATIWDYALLIEPDFYEKFQGISDHTPTMELFQKGLENPIRYWEKHVRIGDGYLEDDWSITLDSLEKALMEVSHD